MEQHQIHQQGRSQQQRQQHTYQRAFNPTFIRLRFRNKREFLLPWTFAENIHDLSFVDIVTGDKVKKIYNWRDRAKKHATATDN